MNAGNTSNLYLTRQISTTGTKVNKISHRIQMPLTELLRIHYLLFCTTQTQTTSRYNFLNFKKLLCRPYRPSSYCSLLLASVGEAQLHFFSDSGYSHCAAETNTSSMLPILHMWHFTSLYMCCVITEYMICVLIRH